MDIFWSCSGSKLPRPPLLYSMFPLNALDAAQSLPTSRAAHSRARLFTPFRLTIGESVHVKSTWNDPEGSM